MCPKPETRIFCIAYIFWWWWGFVSPCLATVARPRDAPIATTTLGQVRGTVDHSRNNIVYYKYMGIPYAEPPVGPLRFESPIPYNTPWQGIRAADNWGEPCLQFDAILRGRVLGSENCLFINIFSRELNPSEPREVLAWVHGGGFTAGSSDMYDPKYFMDHDIVVVTFNYRLASLGFLNTGDELIRGNMGLKDQNLALRFIRDNIRNFGGDPTKVTLFGESAGGASVHYHVVSPLSKGLFHRAIMQSGNIFCPWAHTRSPGNQAKTFGRNVGCPTDNTSILVDCLKRMDGKDIVAEHYKILSPVHLQDDFFPGSVEAVQRDDTFLAENPFLMIKRGDFNRVPVIFGMNSGEGALKTARLEAHPEVMNTLDPKWGEHVAVLLHYNPEMRNVSDKIRHYYIPDTILSEDQPNGTEVVPPQSALENITYMISDGVWFHATKEAAFYHSQYAPVYLNYFSYHSNVLPSTYTFIKSARKRDNVPAEFTWPRYFVEAYIAQLFLPSRNHKRFGACHGDDIMYYWSTNPFLQIRTFSQDYTFSRNLVTSIVQFTKLDNERHLEFAGITWDQVNPNKTMRYMRLDRNAEMIEQPFQERIDFIDSLNIRDPLDPNNW